MIRQIDIGAIVSKVFRTYGQYASVLIPISAVVFLVEAVFNVLALQGLGLALLASIVGIVLSTLFTGMVVELVSDVRDGRLDQSVGGLVATVKPVLLPLIAVSILAGFGIGIGLILLIVPGLVLMTLWAVVAPVVVLERPGVFEAFGRSRALVKGNGWQVFGVIVMFFIIAFVVALILGAIGAGLGDAGQVVLGYVGRVLVAPLVALTAAILYFELRAAQGESDPVARADSPGTGTGIGLAGLPSDETYGSSGFAPPAPPPPPPPPPSR